MKKQISKTTKKIIRPTKKVMVPKKNVVVSPDLKKKATNLYGNIYSFPNYGLYTPRFYALQDNEQGIDNLSRELLVRWSKECTAKLPWIESAIRILSMFSVGSAYCPEYKGINDKWGKIATDWLNDIFYPSCCTRGYAYDFQTLMGLISTTMDTDGDLLCVYGIDRKMPKVQIIPSIRLRSTSLDGLGNATSAIGWAPGPIEGTVMADGVVYNIKTGEAIGYTVKNANNMVNSIAEITEDAFISSRDAHLVFDPRYFDKGRGIPSISSGILQALSLEEMDRFLMDKIKLSSMLGYIESTPSGEGPQELQTTEQLLNLESAQFGVFSPSPNTHAVEIIQGVTNRYIKAEGGEIKMMDSNTPQDETKNFMARLESQILSTLGVPHQLLFSQDTVSGRISDGVAEIFNRSIERRQNILDKQGKFIISWALAQAMKFGYIPENNDENLFNVFSLTHPPKFSLNAGYDRKADLDDLAAGVKSINDITKKGGKTSSEIMEEQEKEATELLIRANRISKETKTDIHIVLQILRDSLKQKTNPTQGGQAMENIRP
jgi:hypothetical protein